VKRFLAVTAALVLGAVTSLWWVLSDGDTRVTAFFERAVGVYPGSDVRVLGVRVGQVDAVTPLGDRVEVVFTVDGDVDVPADTGVAVVAPSVVADRYVQLSGGSSAERIADGAVVPVERTAVPIELDELYASLNDLLVAVGPGGANADGALSELLETGAANLEGNGRAFNESVREFADLARTLSGSEDDVFATVDQLQTFTTMLAENDRQVAAVNEQLAQVTRTLAADRDELAAALAGLGVALGDVQGFVRDNREALRSTVDKLAGVTQTLVDQRASLAEALDVAPLAATNVLGAFDPATGTLQGRVNLLEYLVSYPTSPAAPAPAVALPLPVTGGG
jgi:phospholipid/cholesterol/gamma-HCH transport system substrate-binding protein